MCVIMLKSEDMKMSETTSMTQGSIFKSLVYFSLPVLLGNIFQQLYNMADTAIIGHYLGDEALAAVGAASPVYGLLIGLAYGLTNGFAVVIARHYGAGDEKRLKRAVSITYLLSAAVALVLTVSGIIGLEPLMKALSTPEDIFPQTDRYLRIIITFSVLTIAYNMLAGMLRAVGNSKAPLLFLVISALLNVGLDILFVRGLKMGVPGAAYATVISQGLSVVLCFIYVVKKCGFLVFKFSQLKPDKAMISDLSLTGLSMGLMYAIVSVGSVILQGAVNSLGTATITAHTAARKIDEIFMMPLGTMAISCATYSSQNYGAGKTDRVKKGVICAILITQVWSAVSVIFALLLRRPMVIAISGSSDSTVISYASRYLLWNMSFYFVLGVLVVTRTSLQGMGRKLVPIMGSVLEFVLKIVVSAWLAPRLGYFGVCICEPMIWIFCAALVGGDFVLIMKKLGQDKKKVRLLDNSGLKK